MAGDDRSVLILYGSETGTAQDLAESLFQACRRLRFQVRIEEMNAVELSSLLPPSIVIFVISTTGQGDLPRNALVFWKKLLRRKLAPGCLARVRFTTFGLGDSVYPRFNWAARKLHKRLEQLGATEFYPRAEGDERHGDGIDTAWLPWSGSLHSQLLAEFPLPPSLAPFPDDALLPPRFPLSFPSSSSAPSGLLPIPIPESIDATLLANTRITPSSHFQDVRLLTLSLPGPLARPITPGDCLTVYPTNPHSCVSRLTDLMSWSPVADLPVAVPPSHISSSAAATTLRTLLTHNLDILAVPRRSLLASLASMASDPTHRARLLELADPRLSDELYDYTTRPRRTTLEVLEEFHSVKIPAERVLDVFPALRGRDFSVASCPSSSPVDAVPGNGSGDRDRGPATVEVDLLVALVKYRTILRVPREGLCSRHLAPLEPGCTLRVLHKPALTPMCPPPPSSAIPASPYSRPLVAIAAGTGVAPVRALVQDRLRRQGDGDAVGATVLFFGCRNRSADFYFADEWAAAAGTRDADGDGYGSEDGVRQGGEEAKTGGGNLQVFTAFSRDQRHKVYVQDVLHAQAPLVARLVRAGAAFCLCGGSAKMAEACKAAVLDALVREGVAATEDGAREVFGKVPWWQEIWS